MTCREPGEGGTRSPWLSLCVECWYRYQPARALPKLGGVGSDLVIITLTKIRFQAGVRPPPIKQLLRIQVLVF